MLDDRCPLVSTDHDSDTGRLRLLVHGDLDAVSAHRLQQSLIDVLRRTSPCDLVVDLSGVTFLDSAGLEALLRCQADAEQLECRLALVNPGPEAYRVLQIAGLLARFGLARPRPGAGAPGPAGAELGLVNCGLAG